jgi:hypothetical protein
VSTTAASSGVVVLLGGVVGMLPAWSMSSGWKPFSGSSEERRWRVRRHFLLGGVALEDLWLASLAVWLDGCWMLCRLVGLLVRSLVFFFLLLCFSFASLQGLEFKHPVVIVGLICPLVDVEAGFIILNLKKWLQIGCYRFDTAPL